MNIPHPDHLHTESHFTDSETVRDIVIGMSDGLTVPFALAAGLSGAVDSSGIILTAGLAEVAAGAIAMGLGGYLAARTDIEHFVSERAREEREVVGVPHKEMAEVTEIRDRTDSAPMMPPGSPAPFRPTRSAGSIS